MPLSISIRTNGTNTFIALSGEIRAESSGQIAEAVSRYHHPEGRCFISTDAAEGCEADARARLHQELVRYGIKSSALYFKGRFAFDLAPDGCRVLVVRQPEKEKAYDSHASVGHHCRRPGCTGNCAACPRCNGKAS